MLQRRFSDLRRWFLMGVLPLLSLSAGCSLQDALVDGFFAGISNTVSALVVDAVAAFGGG